MNRGSKPLQRLFALNIERSQRGVVRPACHSWPWRCNGSCSKKSDQLCERVVFGKQDIVEKRPCCPHEKESGNSRAHLIKKKTTLSHVKGRGVLDAVLSTDSCSKTCFCAKNSADSCVSSSGVFISANVRKCVSYKNPGYQNSARYGNKRGPRRLCHAVGCSVDVAHDARFGRDGVSC